MVSSPQRIEGPAKSLLLLLFLACLLESFTLPVVAAFSLLSASPSSKQLIDQSQTFLTTASGVFGPLDPDAYADDFVFRGGVIGPLNKRDFVNTMEKLGVYQHFDLKANPSGHAVEQPKDGNTRIRYFLRMTGQQTKPWQIQNVPVSFGINREPVVGPTESHVLEFDKDGKLRMWILGSPTAFGNPEPVSTGGKFGAVLGLVSHTGNALAAESATVDFVRTFTNGVARLLGSELGPPVTASKPEDIPAWWYETEENKDT